MRNLLLIPAAIGFLALTTGCPMDQQTARVRVIHASPDAPAVDVCADGSALFQGAEFPGGTDYATVPAGTYDIAVTGAGAGCDATAVIAATLPFDDGTDTTVAAINVLNDIEPLVLADDNTAPNSGEARVRFVHAGPDAPTVDITLPDGTTLFDDVSFGESGGYIAVDAGTYTLEVRDATGTVTVLTLDGVSLADGAVYSIFAVGLLNGEPALDAAIFRDR